MKSRPPAFVVTGGAACGKSTVAAALATALGALFHDSDREVRELLLHDHSVRQAVCKAFPSACTGDQSISKPALRAIVLADPSARRQLELLLHPGVRAAREAARQTAISQNRALVAEIPLFFETRCPDPFDQIVGVFASPTIQLQRLDARGLPPREAHALLEAQLPWTAKIPSCDRVLWNDGSSASLQRQIAILLQEMACFSNFQPTEKTY